MFRENTTIKLSNINKNTNIINIVDKYQKHYNLKSINNKKKHDLSVLQIKLSMKYNYR